MFPEAAVGSFEDDAEEEAAGEEQGEVGEREAEHRVGISR